MIKALEETDSTRNKTSKKDPDTRREEVRKAASPELLRFLEKRDTVIPLVSNPSTSLVVAEIMLFADGGMSISRFPAFAGIHIDAIDSTAASTALLSTLIPQDDDRETLPSINSSHVARLFKSLLQGGHFSQSSGSVEKSPYFDAGAFTRAFLHVLGEERIVEMSKSGGTFVVVELLQAVSTDEQLAQERALVRSWFTSEVKEQIRNSDVKGRELLIEKIEQLAR